MIDLLAAHHNSQLLLRFNSFHPDSDVEEIEAGWSQGSSPDSFGMTVPSLIPTTDRLPD